MSIRALVHTLSAERRTRRRHYTTAHTRHDRRLGETIPAPTADPVISHHHDPWKLNNLYICHTYRVIKLKLTMGIFEWVVLFAVVTTASLHDSIPWWRRVPFRQRLTTFLSPSHSFSPHSLLIYLSIWTHHFVESMTSILVTVYRDYIVVVTPRVHIRSFIIFHLYQYHSCVK